MQRLYFGRPRWHLVSPVPAGHATVRRWNIFIISALALLVLGVFIATIGSGLVNNAAATTGAPRYFHLKKTTPAQIARPPAAAPIT